MKKRSIPVTFEEEAMVFHCPKKEIRIAMKGLNVRRFKELLIVHFPKRSLTTIVLGISAREFKEAYGFELPGAARRLEAAKGFGHKAHKRA